MSGLRDLERLLQVGPVMAEAHVLWPAALPTEVVISHSAAAIAFACDDPSLQTPTPIYITETSPRWESRFGVWRAAAPPAAADIDRRLPDRAAYLREALPSQASAAAHLADQFLGGGYDFGALLLVDGLSFFDCVTWPERACPCFVDGPSITEYGFLQIMQASALVRRLVDHGRISLRAYAYWERERNALAARVFEGAPLQRVRTFSDLINAVRADSGRVNFVIALREGLDALVHRRRELTRVEREATVSAIHRDLQELVAMARERKCRSLVALLADHGIVWREETDFRVVERSDQSLHGRFSERPPSAPDLASRMGPGPSTVYCYHPGLLCREPRANEAGFHGGLSARESLVPFILVELA